MYNSVHYQHVAYDRLFTLTLHKLHKMTQLTDEPWCTFMNTLLKYYTTNKLNQHII
jgi:hypothetical protein